MLVALLIPLGLAIVFLAYFLTRAAIAEHAEPKLEGEHLAEPLQRHGERELDQQAVAAGRFGLDRAHAADRCEVLEHAAVVVRRVELLDPDAVVRGLGLHAGHRVALREAVREPAAGRVQHAARVGEGRAPVLRRARAELLEQGEAPLETSLTLFEEGMQLSSSCRKELEDAEGKIEILLKQNGKVQPEPFER